MLTGMRQRKCTISIEHSITHTYPDLRTFGQFKDILSIRTSERHRRVDTRVAKRPEKKWSREPPTASLIATSKM